MLQTEKPFVQLDWRPVSALPPQVSDLVDVDGDGQPDIRVSFDVPKDPKAPLCVNVETLNPRYQAMQNAGKEKFSKLIVRVDDAILVRIPLTRPSRRRGCRLNVSTGTVSLLDRTQRTLIAGQPEDSSDKP